MKTPYIAALLTMLVGVSFALTCVSNEAPELNEWYLVSCSEATANSSCFSQVERTDDNRIVDYQPETAFNVYKESVYATSDGFAVIPIRIKPDIYFEGENYTVTTFCGADNSSGTFIVGTYQNPSQMFGSFTKWGSENMPVIIMISIGVAVFAGMGLYVVNR